MPDGRRALGDAGERLAGLALQARGWRILDRKARSRYGEIDLVCHDGSSYVFVEVKTRSSSSFVSAAEAVDLRKVERIRHLAEAWLAAHGRRAAPWRIAVVALTVGPDAARAVVLDVTD